MTSITNDGNEIRFTAPLFQPGSNWHTIVQFGSGCITVEPGEYDLAIHYRLSSIKMLIGIGVMVGALCLFGVAEGKSHFDQELLVSLSIGWVWLFGASYIWGAIRFPKWLKEGMITMPAPEAASA